MQYRDPATMVVLATGHLVRCILWEPVAVFYKGIGYLCWLKFFALAIFCEEYLHQVYVW